MFKDEYLAEANLARFPFLFVVTIGRSGSTLLQGLLNSMPGYCIRGENNSALYHLFASHSAAEVAKKQFGMQSTDERNPWFGAELISPKDFGSEIADVFLKHFLQPPPGTRCVGFKEIRYTPVEISESDFERYLDFLQEVFPGAAFVFNVRHIDDVVRSGWWGIRPEAHVRPLLAAAMERFSRYAQAHANCFIFDYDKFVARPEYSRELYGFLGESWDRHAVECVLATPHNSSNGRAGPDSEFDAEMAQRSLNVMRRDLIRAKKKQSELESQLSVEIRKARVAARRAADVERSTTWRIMAPARNLMRRLRRSSWRNPAR